LRLTTFLLTLAAAVVAVAMSQAPRAAPAFSTPAPVPLRAPEQPPERSVVGTLDHVDATASEFVVNTSTGKQNFRLQAGATIRQGSKVIKPAELAAHKGERVKVRYRESGGVRRAEWIVVASPPVRKGGPKSF
jgi:hypothetical protein